mgnify:CR=1 FL=1
MDSKYNLLLTKDIFAILDGDTEFGPYQFSDGSSVQLQMPYLSGPVLCELATKFGLAMKYSRKGGNLSRWMYLKELMEYCITNKKISSFLSYLFAKQQFSKLLSGHPPTDIDDAYRQAIRQAQERINSLLYFGGHELAIVGDQYMIRSINESVSIKSPKINTITRGYIREISERALQDINLNHFDSAITKSRTLLEEVFIYVIEQRQPPSSHYGKINELYRNVKSLYNMHADSSVDKRVNHLLSGLEKIISSIAEMRNAEGDAHGVGAKRIGIDDYHARLFVNAATTVADFILAVANKQNRY